MPQYEPAIAPARIFIFTGVATGLASLSTVAILAIERHHLLPIWAGLGVLLNLGLSVGALRSGLGLEGVAVGALLSQSLYTGVVLVLMVRSGGLGASSTLTLALLMPLLWCAGMLLLIEQVVPMRNLASTLAGLGVFLVLTLPVSLGLFRIRSRLL